MIREDSNSEIEPPQFSHYEPNVLKMMENMGYDLTSGPALNFGKGRRTLLRLFISRGKIPDYYHRTRRVLGYVSTPIPSASEFEELLYHNHCPACHRGSQISMSVISSKIFWWTWFQQATRKMERRKWSNQIQIPGSNTWILSETFALNSVNHLRRIR